MISDNDLLLYHFEDGLRPDERERIARALATDASVAARFKQLVADMATLATDAAPEVSVPAASQHRWRTDLDRAARVEKDTPRKSSHWKWGGLAATGTALGIALLVSSVGVNVLVDTPTGGGVTPPVDAAGAEAARYERSLQLHLAQTESQLAGLQSANGDERSRVIDKVMVQNRLYAIAAERANEERLARVLRSFTPLLEALADRNTNPAELAGGIAQLNFELKVMQARLATAAPASSNLARQALAL
ncbi:MAG: hypothetical protein JNN20_19100 [Betaproteobacteria bacterium]|nr:hypothetical protein [Betaproteobacteria bacterium]